MEGRSARCSMSKCSTQVAGVFLVLSALNKEMHALPDAVIAVHAISERLLKHSSVALRHFCVAAVHAADLRAGDVWSHCHRLLHHRHSWAHCACGEELQDLLCCQASQVIPCDSF